MAEPASPLLPERLAMIGFDLAERSFCKLDAIRAEKRGKRLGELAYILDKKHRLRTISNLALAFPEWSEARRLKVAKDVFRHFGMVLGDFLRAPIRSNEEVNASITMEGYEHFAEAKQMNLGILMITAHFGNWERYAQYVTAQGEQIAVVARDANQGELQKRVVRIREAKGASVLSRGSAAREIIKGLRSGAFIAILPDQNDDEVFVPFFGKPAGSVLGPAVLHQRTGAPLLPAYLARVGPGKYQGFVKPIIDKPNLEADREKIMAAINESLEEVVREYPEQWLWMHDRWKSARNKGLL